MHERTSSDMSRRPPDFTPPSLPSPPHLTCAAPQLTCAAPSPYLLWPPHLACLSACPCLACSLPRHPPAHSPHPHPLAQVGIGPGSVCTTRKQTGVGYPQLSA